MYAAMKEYRNGELSRRIKVKLTETKLWDYLMSIAGGAAAAVAKLETGHFVIAIKIDGVGRTVRGYGRTVIDCLRSILYTVFCAGEVW